MRIVKILNNNTVLVIENDVLSVLTGKGIGFNVRKGDNVPNNIEFQKFVLDPDGTIQKYLDLLREIPDEVFECVAKIIDYAKNNIPRKFSSTVFWTLADHINFAIDRKANGLDLKNTLHLEIKMFYPEEYEVGKEALKIIFDRLNVQFLEDEESFIAMHFVNAELGENIPQTMRITQTISDVATIIAAKYDRKFNKESLSYYRFVTHIKFFAQRLFKDDQEYEQADDDLYSIVKHAFPKHFEGAELIAEYVYGKYGKEVETQEIAYLTVHLKRVLDSND
ncbi:MAG: PRD domain-containing protein [Bifidobacteriaceae bacterium]|jgi:beta-glucoside operon transcriptional antiterminator|nr:PRD domain-containing protein [Bifidobacteriaceae bacterium]